LWQQTDNLSLRIIIIRENVVVACSDASVVVGYRRAAPIGVRLSKTVAAKHGQIGVLH